MRFEKILFTASLISLPVIATPEWPMATSVTKSHVVFQVETGGCTSKESFVLNQNVNGRNHALSLERIKEDHCKAFLPDGTTITYTFEELGIRPGHTITIQNAIAPWGR